MSGCTLPTYIHDRRASHAGLATHFACVGQAIAEPAISRRNENFKMRVSVRVWRVSLSLSVSALVVRAIIAPHIGAPFGRGRSTCLR